jgi:hypothetical protein
MCRTQDAARLRTQEVLLKDDLAILFAADLGPAISAVETFGASTRLSGQHRRRVPAFLQYIAGKGKQARPMPRLFVKRVAEKCTDRPVARVCRLEIERGGLKTSNLNRDGATKGCTASLA